MELVRHVLVHVLAGCLAGIVGAVAVVATNLGSLRDLMLQTQGGGLAFALLVFGFMVTFGSAAVGHGIMTIGDSQGEAP
jgi:hypothetical protein